MNSSIVIALPKIDDAKKIRTILNRHGFSVAAVCSTASTALASMSELDGGILICGYKLTDRYYRDVLEDIPSYFEMLLLASGRVIAEAPTSVLTVEMPMKVSDLVNTVDMMLFQIERRLQALGMTLGTRIHCITRKGKGIMVILLRGTRFALGYNMTRNITVDKVEVDHD